MNSSLGGQFGSLNLNNRLGGEGLNGGGHLDSHVCQWQRSEMPSHQKRIKIEGRWSDHLRLGPARTGRLDLGRGLVLNRPLYLTISGLNGRGRRKEHGIVHPGKVVTVARPVKLTVRPIAGGKLGVVHVNEAE